MAETDLRLSNKTVWDIIGNGFGIITRTVPKIMIYCVVRELIAK